VLFMVVEKWREQDARAVYRRLREQGRQTPEGLKYVGNWVEANFDRCWQLMECDDVRVLQEWVLGWRDLGEFEIVALLSGRETAEHIESML
jgi:hypothetical protein